MLTSGSHALLELLARSGVRYLFGNPGTTELPLMDALAQDRRIQYVLGLQEVPVMAIADGYAQASRTVGVVNLHIACGLGNGMGMLYNAFREGSPLVVTAGQQDRRLRFDEPILWADMVRVARPWTKWAVEVDRVEDLPSALRRAIQTALMPPTGPVFLSLPVDVLSAEAELDLSPPCPLNPHVRPPTAELRRAVDLLTAASNPAILVGSRVVEADAVEPLVDVAGLLGAPVLSEPATTQGRLSFPSGHPLFAPGLPLWSPDIRRRLDEFDVLLVVGMDLLRLYVYHEPARAIPEKVRIVHLDADPWPLGKNYPIDVGLVGDPKVGLEELGEMLRARLTSREREAAATRASQRVEKHRTLRQALEDQAGRERGERPLTPLTVMQSLGRALTPTTAVIEEAVTTTNAYLQRLGLLGEPSGYFGHRGWALGWGLGCAIGVKLAWPDRPVLAVLGEGAAMYGIQGLWTAAHYRIPVTFVICNNAQYQILKVGARAAELPAAGEGKFEGMDLVEPEIDFVALARSLGVEARRVHDPDELTECVRRSFEADGPRLFDVPITRALPSKLDY